MDHFVLNTTGTPTILIRRVGGSLRLSGWDQNQVQAEGSTSAVSADERDGGITASADGDCALHVPRRASITIEHVNSDAKVKMIEGEAAIKFIGGDLTLRQMGDVQVERVDGDLNAKRINGSLSVVAGGDASVRSVAGEVALETGGDVYLRDVGGSVRVKAGVNAVLNTAFNANHAYDVQAGSDVLCRVPANTSAKFSIRAGGEISVDVLGVSAEGSARQKTITMGGGAAAVSLIGGGDVSLSALAADPDSMGDFGDRLGREFGMMAEEFAAQIELQMAELEKHLQEQMASLNIDPASGLDTKRIVARARAAAERAADTARRKGEAARRRAEVKIEAAQRRVEQLAERRSDRARRKTGTFFLKFDTARPMQSQTPPPVSDEERLAILKMLEQGKITVEQAEKLLTALEGEQK